MTKSRYLWGCVSGSQEHGKEASSPADCAWLVNFYNGGANWYDQNGSGYVRAVRAGECQSVVTLRSLHTAWRRARRAKKPSANQLSFDTYWAEKLLILQDQLNAGIWHPALPTCFIAKEPKAREIHAPDFADRVVHHWLVPQLETLYEPTFIFDCYSNRVGKGTHAALTRLQDFFRQVDSGQAAGWYLQLDVHNFFNSIHRPTLYAMLKHRIEREGLPLAAQRATHALLRHSPLHGGVRYACSAHERAVVPPHKRLENAAPGCGIAIGNLSSQFFANVYLDALDQFVKHELRAPRYLRYVDDFVLVHPDREQLVAWQAAIAHFLKERLRLTLKADVKLRRLRSGADFLGYVVYPTHTAVRRRVIAHARQRLADWERRHVETSRIVALPLQFLQLRSQWESYRGHFAHANSFKLKQRFMRRFPWLHEALSIGRIDYRLEQRLLSLRRRA